MLVCKPLKILKWTYTMKNKHINCIFCNLYFTVNILAVTIWRNTYSFVHRVVEHSLLTMWNFPHGMSWPLLMLWPEVLLSFWICPGIVLRWCNPCQHMHTVNSIPALWDEMKRTVLGKNWRETKWTGTARRRVFKYSRACGMCSWWFIHFTLILPLVMKITQFDGKNACSNYNRKIIVLQRCSIFWKLLNAFLCEKHRW